MQQSTKIDTHCIVLYKKLAAGKEGWGNVGGGGGRQAAILHVRLTHKLISRTIHAAGIDELENGIEGGLKACML